MMGTDILPLGVTSTPTTSNNPSRRLRKQSVRGPTHVDREGLDCTTEADADVDNGVPEDDHGTEQPCFGIRTVIINKAACGKSTDSGEEGGETTDETSRTTQTAQDEEDPTDQWSSSCAAQLGYAVHTTSLSSTLSSTLSSVEGYHQNSHPHLRQPKGRQIQDVVFMDENTTLSPLATASSLQQPQNPNQLRHHFRSRGEMDITNSSHQSPLSLPTIDLFPSESNHTLATMADDSFLGRGSNHTNGVPRKIMMNNNTRYQLQSTVYASAGGSGNSPSISSHKGGGRSFSTHNTETWQSGTRIHTEQQQHPSSSSAAASVGNSRKKNLLLLQQQRLERTESFIQRRNKRLELIKERGHNNNNNNKTEMGMVKKRFHPHRHHHPHETIQEESSPTSPSPLLPPPVVLDGISTKETATANNSRSQILSPVAYTSSPSVSSRSNRRHSVSPSSSSLRRRCSGTGEDRGSGGEQFMTLLDSCPGSTNSDSGVLMKQRRIRIHRDTSRHEQRRRASVSNVTTTTTSAVRATAGSGEIDDKIRQHQSPPSFEDDGEDDDYGRKVGESDTADVDDAFTSSFAPSVSPANIVNVATNNTGPKEENNGVEDDITNNEYHRNRFHPAPPKTPKTPTSRISNTTTTTTTTSRQQHQYQNHYPNQDDQQYGTTNQQQQQQQQQQQEQLEEELDCANLIISQQQGRIKALEESNREWKKRFDVAWEEHQEQLHTSQEVLYKVQEDQRRTQQQLDDALARIEQMVTTQETPPPTTTETTNDAKTAKESSAMVSNVFDLPIGMERNHLHNAATTQSGIRGMCTITVGEGQDRTISIVDNLDDSVTDEEDGSTLDQDEDISDEMSDGMDVYFKEKSQIGVGSAINENSISTINRNPPLRRHSGSNIPIPSSVVVVVNASDLTPRRRNIDTDEPSKVITATKTTNNRQENPSPNSTSRPRSRKLGWALQPVLPTRHGQSQASFLAAALNRNNGSFSPRRFSLSETT
jgi:hypothetical protein